MSINYEFYAKKIIKNIVERILDEDLIEKSITYSELANEIDFPEPFQGNQFSGNIGRTLGLVGELLEQVQEEDDQFSTIPIIQTLVVNKGNNLPSYGLRAFVPGYDALTDDEKEAFVHFEHEKISLFGASNWLKVLDKLGIKYDKSKFSQKKMKGYNPFGSEGSPEHIAVKKIYFGKTSFIGLFRYGRRY